MFRGVLRSCHLFRSFSSFVLYEKHEDKYETSKQEQEYLPLPNSILVCLGWKCRVDSPRRSHTLKYYSLPKRHHQLELAPSSPLSFSFSSTIVCVKDRKQAKILIFKSFNWVENSFSSKVKKHFAIQSVHSADILV